MATQFQTRSSLSHPLESIIHSSFESILSILILLFFNAVESSSKEENDRKDSATNNRMKKNDVRYSQNICGIFGRREWIRTYVRQVWLRGWHDDRKRKGIEANRTWFENIIVKVGRKASKSIQNILTQLQFYRQPIRRRGRWSDLELTYHKQLKRRVRRKIHWYSSSIHSTSYDEVQKVIHRILSRQEFRSI